jgi:hypothetical protein
LFDQIFYCSCNIFNRNIWIHPMLLEPIDRF